MAAERGIPFGSYTLLRRVARGGMAEVFLAKQRGLEGFDRRVAVKRILPQLADSNEFLQMFMAEARLAARLNHPNIVHIYEFGKNGDDYFIAMEFVDGVHAGQIIDIVKHRPIPWTLLARIGADAASALHHAHQLTDESGKRLGLVHRDMSPANLLITTGGTAKLVDFGIAKAVEVSDQRTSPGMVKGKFSYMSPEQTVGATLDGRSDVFSLCIVLWELATGRHLVDRGDPGAAMRTIRDGKLPPVESIAKNIPVALSQAIAWGLEVDRDHRATAADLAQSLESFIKESPELATAMQLAAWVNDNFPTTTMSASVELSDADDDFGGAPRRRGGSLARPVAGPRTVVAPETDAGKVVSEVVPAVAVIAPANQRGPSYPSSPPLIGASIVPPSRPSTNSRESDSHLESTAVREPGSPPVAITPRRQAPARLSSDVAVADRSEEMARTDVFTPTDPQELDRTQQRQRLRTPSRADNRASQPGRIEPQRAIPNHSPPPPRTTVAATNRTVPTRFNVADQLSTEMVSALPVTTAPKVHSKIWLVVAVAAVTLALAAAWWSLNEADSNSNVSTRQLTWDAGAPASAPDARLFTTTPLVVDGRTTDAVAQAVPQLDIPADVAVVEISTKPSGAIVAFDGRTGTSPARFETKAGQHVVTAEFPGYLRNQQALTAIAGQMVSVQVALEPEPVGGAPVGSAALRAQPNAEVFENKRSLGRTPLNVSLPIGSHTLLFKTDGYRLITKQVVIKRNRTTAITVKMRK
jgi:eukaryotic-like serine/threonine-protein kinase